MIGIFEGECKKRKYTDKIDDCFSIVLQFYKEYNFKFYEIILNGLNNKKIIIDNNVKVNEVVFDNNEAYIKLQNSDMDLFLLTHEFAHFIDRNSNPYIILDEVNFLGEAFLYYIEKRMENWLGDNYKD